MKSSKVVKFGKVKKKKLPGIVIDRNLSFHQYILSHCKKAGKTLSVLARICNFTTIEHRTMLKKTLLNLSSVIAFLRECVVIEVVIIA